MKDIAILGAGGLAREVAFLIEDINRHTSEWRIIGFIDQDESMIGKRVGKYTIRFAEEQLDGLDCVFAVGIGEPQSLVAIRDRHASLLPSRFPNLIHPSVVMDRDSVELGYGNVLCAGAIMTTDIRIGSLNIINLQCTIGHDVRIADGCVLNPASNISGNVTIEDGCLIGTGAQVLQGLAIGAGSRVGAGAVVVRDVEPGAVVVGVPARPMKG